MLLAVIGIFGLSLASLGIGLYKTFAAFKYIFTEGLPDSGDKSYLLGFIETVDLFLLATVFYIIALGLYELFIDADIKVPAWLEVKSIDDLKVKLIVVIVMTLAVLFLGKIISWDGKSDLMGFGIAIGAVVFSLSYFIGKKEKE